MGITFLDPTNALSEGADLWVVPAREISKWARSLDWYLNFQLSRSTLHKTPEISGTLKEILREYDQSEFNLHLERTAPLLIATHHILPTARLLRVEYMGDLKTWFTEIREHWKNLNKPRVRLFLPQTVTQHQAQKLLQSLWKPDDSDLSCVEDIASERHS